jgi:predicted ester cyclase
MSDFQQEIKHRYEIRDTQYAFLPPLDVAIQEIRNKGAVARCDNNIFHFHDVEYLNELYVQDYVDYDLFPGQPPGLDGFKESFKWYLEAFPDLHTVVDNMVAEGDMVVVFGFFEGTQVGPFLGIPASGLQVSSRRCEAMRFNVDSRCVERWGVGAELRFLQAMKVIPTLDVAKGRLAKPESLARVFAEEFFTNLNPAAIAELVDKRARADSKGMLALFQVASAFHDVKLTIGELGAQGPQSATFEAEIGGTHAGRGLGRATDARRTAKLQISTRIAHGKIVDFWSDVEFSDHGGSGAAAQHREARA